MFNNTLVYASVYITENCIKLYCSSSLKIFTYKDRSVSRLLLNEKSSFKMVFKM